MANKITSATPYSAADSSEDLVFLDGQEASEFSYWEFINQSDVDSDTDSLHSVENGFVSWYTSSAPPLPGSADSGEEIENEPVLESRDVVDTVNLIGVRDEEVEMDEEVDENEIDDDDQEIETEPVLEGRYVVDPANMIAVPAEEEETDEEYEEKEIDYDDDELNDDLVPWNLRGKFGGKQRMRKLGKRFCSKMVNTKRDRYAYVKRGCVRGKRELEMEA